MKKFFLAFICTILFFSLHGQTLRWGAQPRDRAGNRSNTYIQAAPDGGAYCLSEEFRMYPSIYVPIIINNSFFEYYDKDFNIVIREKLKLKNDDGRSLVIQDFISTENGQYLISSGVESANASRSGTFYAHPIDPEKHLPMAKPIELLQVKDANSVGVHLSFDKSKVAFFVDISDKRKESETFFLSVFSSDFQQKLFQMQITLPYLSKDFVVRSMKVDNYGAVYLIGQHYLDKKHRSSVFTVLAYRSLGEEFKEYTVESDGAAIGDVNMGVSPDGKLTFAGLYAKESGSIATGVIFFTIDPESRCVSRMTMKPFTPQVLKAIGYRDEQAEGSYKFDIRQMLMQADGGCTIVGEESFSVMRTTTSNYGAGSSVTSSQTVYYRLGMIAVSFSGTGEVNWMAGIPKYGVGVNSTLGLSYGLAAGGDKLYLIYNDHPDNLNYPESGERIRPWKVKKGVLVLAVIDANGKVTRKSIGSFKENKIFVYPNFSKQVAARRLLIVGSYGRRPRLGELTL